MPADGMRAAGSPERRFGTPLSAAQHKAYPGLLTRERPSAPPLLILLTSFTVSALPYSLAARQNFTGRCPLHMLRCIKFSPPMSQLGQTLPSHPAPMPTDVRYAPMSGSEIEVLALGMAAG